MDNQTKTVAVLGAGTMGSGIATVMTRAGHRTTLYDVDEANLQRGLDSVRAFIDRSVRLGKLDGDTGERAKRGLVGSTDLTDLAPCDVVVEAVYEDLALKKEIFGRLDDIVAPTALLHTNTSTLPVTGIASGSRLPERVVGTHYCNPAPLMKLVEVADGRHTADWAHKGTLEFLRSLGKTTVVTKDRPGFIVNRFLIPWENSCIAALEAGVGTRESIDAAVLGSLGHPSCRHLQPGPSVRTPFPSRFERLGAQPDRPVDMQASSSAGRRRSSRRRPPRDSRRVETGRCCTRVSLSVGGT